MRERPKFLGGVALLVLLIAGPISSVQAVVDRVVAVVNEEIITLSEIERWMGSNHDEIQAENPWERRKQLHAVYRKALDRLVEEKLIDQEAKRTGTKATAKEVESAVEDVKQRHGLDQDGLEKVLARDGFTLETYKKEIEKKIQRMKLLNRAIKVEPVEEKELRDFYQKNIDRYLANEVYRPCQIFLAVPKDATPQEVQRIRKKCEDILKRVKRGEDFMETALLYTQDISAKDRGDLGYFRKGELLPTLEKEVMRLQIGEISGIIRTEFGFHIIKLLDRKGGVPLPFEDVKAKVRAEYYGREMEKAFQQFLSTLKEKSVIEIKL